MSLNYNVKGSVNYTITGSPTIVDGILSNITSSNFVYVNVAATAPAMTDIIELGIACTTSSTIGSSGLFSRGNADFAGICINSLGKPYARYQKLSDSTVAASVTSDVTMQANTTYYIKMLKTANTLSISVSSDNQTWTTNSTSIDTSDIKMFRTFNIGYGNSNIGGSFEGTIDLNKTYIKINGAAVFGVCPVEVKHIDYGTALVYEKVGSPSIENGILTTTSSSDYAKTPTISVPIDISKDKIEILETVSFGSTVGTSNGYLDARGLTSFSSGVEQKVRVNWSGTSSVITSNTVLQPNTTYKIKTVYENSTISLYMAAGSADYSLEGTYDATGDTQKTLTFLAFGRNSSSVWLQEGNSIDLNNTYIKINGKLFFYRPCTNYLVKDDKLVWCDQDLYLNDSGTITLASQDTAPVPSGFTYGSTTTTDVGLVDIPSQVFTAKPGATIGKGTPPSGPDENTILLLHFDDNMNDSSRYSQTFESENVSFNYTTGKFGKALDSVSRSNPYNAVVMRWRYGGEYVPITNGFTYEYWQYVDTDKWYGYREYPTIYNSNRSVPAWYLYLYNKNLVFQAGPVSGSVVYDTISPYLIENDWNHLAASYNPNDAIRIFVNGHVVSTLTPSGWLSPAQMADYRMSYCVMYPPGNWPQWVGAEEVRISDICRYTADFTPPSSPF